MVGVRPAMDLRAHPGSARRLDGVPYRGSVVRIGGYACIGVRNEHPRAGSAPRIGSEIAVTLAFDAEER